MLELGDITKNRRVFDQRKLQALSVSAAILAWEGFKGMLASW